MINWSDCSGVCTVGAAAMTGRQSRVVQCIKKVAPLAVSMHCFLHREELTAKEMEPSLHGVLDGAVKILNFVKARAANSQLFTALCEECTPMHLLQRHLYFKNHSMSNNSASIKGPGEIVFLFLSSK